MKQIFLSWILLMGLASETPLNAQDNLDAIIAAKVDSILALQRKTLAEVQYVDPLVNKTFGIEFNPAYFMFGSANHDKVFSGTISLLDLDRKAEIAIPLFYSNSRPFTFFDVANRTKVFTADVIYRRFLGAHQNGFYFSLGGRYAYIKGDIENYYSNYYYDANGNYVSLGVPTKTTTKLGILTGIGYRYFAKSGFYWGTSLSAGRYLTGNMHMRGLDGGKLILDLELLKFGLTF